MTKTNAAYRAAVAPFERPSLARASYQIVTSACLYIATLALMYWSLHISYLLTLVLALPATVLTVRTFIVQHDCGHGSFFENKTANTVLGSLCGVLTLAPYAHWQRQHAQHHASWNNLDRRDTGVDIYSMCLTVDEYRARSPWQRFLYRLPRHPLIANFVFPPLVFLLLYRVPFDTPRDWARERRSVWLTNIAVVALWSALAFAFGVKGMLLVQLPVVILTTIIGVWLFTVQHKFEDARWSRRENWNFADAAMHGSSYLKLPAVLHWMTGNIGYHHIHHLSPRVPNYRLAACHNSSALLQPDQPLSLGRALSAGNFSLWDEAAGKLVRFRDAEVPATD
ncbi:MAG: fatty acid desaturase [Rhizomicrobium sp.]